ncbi:MAG: ribonuclease HII, partial [Candidatus Gastranaerophilales bacterium]|nr:ribonuclease HII [Candidatus Gastranaerophilales bacterium]
MSSLKSAINDLVKFDEQFCTSYCVIGTDEAGRGPVAGPVTAAAVWLEEFDKKLIKNLEYLNDSKKLSSKRRKELSIEIKKCAKYKIIHLSVEQIEKYNILQASLLAMKEACSSIIKENNLILPPKILVDGKFCIPKYDIAQQAVIKGDGKSASIAA